MILNEGNSLFFNLRDKLVRIKTDAKPVWLKKVEFDFHKSRDNKNHYDIDIEQNVLRVEVNFDNKTKKITYTGQDTGMTMDMGDVSSMVSEISPITAYLKYIVRKKPVLNGSCAIIFIEEPEAHLHPKNQVELIKSFAKLVKQNVKLVIASHSNYVFNELNNLVIVGELDESTYCPL